MTALPEIDLSLPYITEGLEGVGGMIKQQPEHFIVEETPAYDPSGYGDHLYVNITKKNLNTRDVQLELAKLFDVKPESVGKAGLKDKRSISTQSFSILFEGEKPAASDVEQIIESQVGVKVNWAKYHTNKLRSGHLRGNRFDILVTGLETGLEEALTRAEAISRRLDVTGVPNFYGYQRVGEEGENTLAGWQLLQGEKRVRNRWLRRYLVSCYQSHLCNRYLAKRVERGLFGTLIHGDIAKKYDTGGMFWVEDVEAEQPRYVNKDITFTAPIYGYKMKNAKHEAHELEEAVLLDSGVTNDQFRKLKAKGTRRPGRIVPIITVSASDEGLRLRFELPKGGFATTVLREYMKNEPQID
jgi:tRNA pseudouridine13 synthase